MSDSPTPAETSLWQRRLAAQANNRAWQLAESFRRTPQEDEEMLQAAHAACFFWKIVGHDGNKAHAAQLLAHVYALLQSPDAAKHYVALAEAHFFERACEPWEKACAWAVKAHVAAAAGQAAVHASSYQEAVRQVAALADPEDRKILEATLRVIPKPG